MPAARQTSTHRNRLSALSTIHIAPTCQPRLRDGAQDPGRRLGECRRLGERGHDGVLRLQLTFRTMLLGEVPVDTVGADRSASLVSGTMVSSTSTSEPFCLRRFVTACADCPSDPRRLSSDASAALSGAGSAARCLCRGCPTRGSRTAFRRRRCTSARGHAGQRPGWRAGWRESGRQDAESCSRPAASIG